MHLTGCSTLRIQTQSVRLKGRPVSSANGENVSVNIKCLKIWGLEWIAHREVG